MNDSWSSLFPGPFTNGATLINDLTLRSSSTTVSLVGSDDFLFDKAGRKKLDAWCLWLKSLQASMEEGIDEAQITQVKKHALRGMPENLENAHIPLGGGTMECFDDRISYYGHLALHKDLYPTSHINFYRLQYVFETTQAHLEELSRKGELPDVLEISPLSEERNPLA